MENLNRSRLLNSILLGVFLNAKLINHILVIIFPSLSGIILKGIYFVIAFFSIKLFFKRIDYKIYFRTYGFLSVIIIFFLITYIFFGSKMSISPLYFIIYVILPFLLIKDVDYRIVMDTILYSSILVLPVANSFFLLTKNNNSISMGLTYACLPVIICAYLHYINFRGEKKFDYFFYLINLFLVIQVIRYGVRGPILCLIIAIMISMSVFFDEETHSIKIKKVQLSITFCLLIIFYKYFKNILIFLQSTANKIGFTLYFVNKSLKLIKIGDLGNGRNIIFEICSSEFVKSPLWGNGLTMFEYNTGIVYPHNIILQLVYDGGLILCMFILVTLVIMTCKQIMICRKKNTYVFFVMLFSIAIPSAFLTGDIWENYRFWTYVAFILYNSSNNIKDISKLRDHYV